MYEPGFVLVLFWKLAFHHEFYSLTWHLFSIHDHCKTYQDQPKTHPILTLGGPYCPFFKSAVFFNKSDRTISRLW